MLSKVVLVLLVAQCLGMDLFNAVELTTKNGAMCLDGSPYMVYTYEPDPVDFDIIANKVLIFFEEADMGWCIGEDLNGTLERCHKFVTEDALIDFGSSKGWGSNYFFLNGILSWGEGGYFANWYKVLLKSCDGGSFLGDRIDPIQYKGSKMYFRGSRNIIEAVNYLDKIKFIKNRQEVVLVGSFNAGVGALLWSDYIKSFTFGKTRIISDASLFLNVENHRHKRPVIENRMKMIAKTVSNDLAIPNKKCHDAHATEQWKCLFVDELIEFIDFPTYFIQSLYDGWDISEVLGFYCTEEFGSLSQCSKEDRKIIEEYHDNVTDSLRKIVNKTSTSGAFGIACVGHQFMGGKWLNEMFEVPMNSGHMVGNTTSAWAEGKGRTIYIDEKQWPSNLPCARKIIQPQHLNRQ